MDEPRRPSIAAFLRNLPAGQRASEAKQTNYKEETLDSSEDGNPNQLAA